MINHWLRILTLVFCVCCILQALGSKKHTTHVSWHGSTLPLVSCFPPPLWGCFFFLNTLYIVFPFLPLPTTVPTYHFKGEVFISFCALCVDMQTHSSVAKWCLSQWCYTSIKVVWKGSLALCSLHLFKLILAHWVPNN